MSAEDRIDGKGVSGERPAPISPGMFRAMFARLHNINRWDLEEAGMIKAGTFGNDAWTRFNTNLTTFVLKLPDEKLLALMALVGLVGLQPGAQAMSAHDKAIEAAALALFNWVDPQGTRYWGKERSLARARAAIAAYEAEKAKETGDAQISILRDQARAMLAARETEQATPDPDGWIPWHGGECPVSPETVVCVRMRGTVIADATDRASNWYWPSTGGLADIIAYRVVKP